MERRRGFLRFGDFAAYALELGAARDGAAEQLLPDLIDGCATQDG